MSAAPLDEAQVSAAVLAYLGWGTRPTPRRDAEAIQADDAPTRQRLLEAVLGVMAELDAFRPDWARQTLTSAAQQVRDRLARAHPGLSPTALEALCWAFTYGWK